MTRRRVAYLAAAAVLVCGIAAAAARHAGDPDPRHERGRSGWIEVADQP